MNINDKTKEIIEKIHLISGNKKENVKNFFESLAIFIIMSYYGKEEIYLPYIGKMKFNYIGEVLDGDFKTAKVEMEFVPDEFLLKNVGQIEDKEEPDVIKFFTSRIQSALGEYLDLDIMGK